MNPNAQLRHHINQSDIRLYDLSRKTKIYESKLKSFLQDGVPIPKVNLIQLGSVYSEFAKVDRVQDYSPEKPDISLSHKHIKRRQRDPELIDSLLKEMYIQSPKANCQSRGLRCVLRSRVWEACTKLGYIETANGIGSTWLHLDAPDQSLLNRVVEVVSELDIESARIAKEKKMLKKALNANK